VEPFCGTGGLDLGREARRVARYVYHESPAPESEEMMAEETKKAPTKKKPAKKPKPKPKEPSVEVLPPVEVNVSSSTIALGTIYVSREFGKIAAKMLEIQREMKHVRRDAENPYYSSHFASLDNVFTVCKRAANKHGLLLVQGAAGDGETIEVTTAVVLPEEEQFMYTSPKLSIGKIGPQPCGAVISFGRRYGLAPLFGLVFSDDDDANAAQDAVKEAEREEQAGGRDRLEAMKAYHGALDVIMKAVEGADDPRLNRAMEKALLLALTKQGHEDIHALDAEKLNDIAGVLVRKREEWIDWFATGAWQGDKPEPSIIEEPVEVEPIVCSTCGEGLTSKEMLHCETVGLRKPYCDKHVGDGMADQMRGDTGEEGSG
jgi:hypothetical protein